MVSQGCRPFGQPLTVTRVGAEPRATRSPVDRPWSAWSTRSPSTSVRPTIAGLEANGFLLGRLVDEHRVPIPGPGDFLFRRVVGVDRATGALAVDDRVPARQHRPLRTSATPARPTATCRRPGRPRRPTPPCCSPATAGAPGSSTTPDHDAAALADALGSGPGRRVLRRRRVRAGRGHNFVHSFTASMALFRDRDRHGPLRRWPTASTRPRCRPAGRVTADDRRHRRPTARPRRRTRTARRQRDPGPGHGRPQGRQLRPPRHGHGPRPAGPRAVHPGPAPRPVRPPLARPRPLRPLQRARLDPAVLHALPHRLRTQLDDLQAVPPVGQPHPRPSRASTTPPGSRSPPARSARASPTASAWAIAERWLRAHFSPEVCDHHTYVIAGDGCLEEGISHEAASLAGHLQLGRLVYVYDDNHITIDGPTELSYNDNVAERFPAYGWDVDDIGEVANDLDALEAALLRARADGGPPVAHHPPEPHRLPVPAPHRHRQGPRRPVRRRGDPADQGAPRPAARRDVLGARRRPRPLPPLHPRGQALRAELGGPLRRLGGRQDPVGRRPARPRPCPGGRRRCRRSPPRTARWPPARPSRPASTPPPTGIPGLMPGSADLTGNTGMAMAGAVGPVGRRPRWEPHPLRHPRARHGRRS